MNYSYNNLLQLAGSNPNELIRIITNSKENVKTLIYGAEILGDEEFDESIVAPVLLQLLKHTHALVREAAMNSIGSFFSNKKPPLDILDRLHMVSNADPLADNKEIAKELIATFIKI
jgi:HEAT repeat protein